MQDHDGTNVNCEWVEPVVMRLKDDPNGEALKIGMGRRFLTILLLILSKILEDIDSRQFENRTSCQKGSCWTNKITSAAERKSICLSHRTNFPKWDDPVYLYVHPEEWVFQCQPDTAEFPWYEDTDTETIKRQAAGGQSVSLGLFAKHLQWNSLYTE